MAGNLIFMIEGGKALELVKHHIEERQRVIRERNALARELGAEDIYVSNMDGVLLGVRFKGDLHPDFKKPDRKGISFPKARTAWKDRFDAQKGYARPTSVIADAFDIPLSIEYAYKDGSGWQSIGNPFNECGFLYPSPNGPYAMWLPDVPTAVAEAEARGQTINEPAKSFKPKFEGCRRIEQEEWDIVVAQHKLAKKRPDLATEPA
ncbi:hypothetical protein QYH69_32345 [Paraburkholderia sp. SARCC-3016]|uniref:hypothetical protein n=1 Tax=Paraburkholderia sp. SARCC-3016 TaxID=3058611 RepID=UPI002809AA36|nr:hypothetical protein [Paraburkholderia sp. SARCC-3016]MDQ7981915.1 hypothetical protein [Paraburkholderia sp. SARCC-3016]